MHKSKIVAMIPARIGSQRLKFKNLALINGKPLISYAIENSIKSKIFKKIVLNSDSVLFESLAKNYKVDFYQRSKELGSSSTKSDDLVFDFLKKYHDFDYLFWINPISPLVDSGDIIESYNHLKKSKSHSMITTNYKQVHAMYNNKYLNFNRNNKFDLTQDLIPVSLFNYAIMAWNIKKFINSYKKNQHAFFCGKFTTFDLDQNKSLIVKTADDLLLIETILKQKKKRKVKYHKLTKMI